MDFDAVVDRVSALLDIDRTEVLLPGRQPHRVKARSMVCYWASRELRMSMVELAKLLKIFEPTESQSATRGEKIVKKNEYKLITSK